MSRLFARDGSPHPAIADFLFLLLLKLRDVRGQEDPVATAEELLAWKQVRVWAQRAWARNAHLYCTHIPIRSMQYGRTPVGTLLVTIRRREVCGVEGLLLLKLGDVRGQEDPVAAAEELLAWK